MDKPKSITLSLCILGAFSVNSFVTQVLLMRGQHKTSLLGLAVWTGIYLAVGFGLHRRKKLAFWVALVIALLQVVPLVVSWLIPMSQLFAQAIPGWYVYSLGASALLGIALLIVLTMKSTRQFMFGRESE